MGRIHDFLDILRSCEGDSRLLDSAINTLIRLSSAAASSSVTATMVSLLETGVQQKMLDARKVCDALLSTEHMKHENKVYWIQSFKVF